mmetsp:Transcript_15285/g.38876  ORF Transcript_15285/g.38876 Transcript_15285/m.38876 type:complete len:151 (-) Transcript_15285:2636-3088(-)
MLSFFLSFPFSKKNFSLRNSQIYNFFSMNSSENRHYRTFQHKAKISFRLKSQQIEQKTEKFFFLSKISMDPGALFHRQKIIPVNKEERTVEQTGQKNKFSFKKRRLTKQHRNKIKQKLIGKNNPMFGRKHSKQTKRKISNKLIQKKKKII